MNKRRILAAAVFAVGGISVAAAPSWAQQDQTNQQGQAATAGQPSAAQPAGAGQGAAGQASSDLSGSAQKAGDRATASQASRSDAGQALSQVANAVLTKGGIQNLSRAFSRDDQQRLGDLSQQAQQIDQPIDQLRQAFKEKYQQDLDVSASADRIFSATFIQIGGNADQAQTASDRLAPDATGRSSGSAGATDTSAAGARTSTSDTSGAASASGATPGTGAAGTAGGETSGAGTSGAGASSAGTSGAGTSGASATGDATGIASRDSSATGASSSGAGAAASGAASSSGGLSDQAQTAGSTSAQQTAVTVAASEGASETRLMLINEAGQWKIDVPDSIDAKQFGQNLQQHLQAAVQSKDQWPADATEGQRAIVRHVLMAFSDSGASGAKGASDTSSGAGTSGAATGAGTGAGAAGTSGTSR